MTRQAFRFDKWFEAEYYRLRERLAVAGVLDEDAFHDTYICVKQHASKPNVLIGDFLETFKREYKRKSMRNISEALMTYNPEDRFWTLLPYDDADGVQSANIAANRQALANKIRRHVHDNYSITQSAIFDLCLWKRTSVTDICDITGVGHKQIKSIIKEIQADIQNRYSLAL